MLAEINILVFFFFSSRRRHTRFDCDWSSDVCSSDLEGHYFVKAAVRYDKTRLVFVVSFHHIGKELTGVIEVTAFLLLETFDEAEEDVLIRGERVSSDVIPSCLEPFVITWTTEPDRVEAAFLGWLDRSL